jgi:hypothetical protein
VQYSTTSGLPCVPLCRSPPCVQVLNVRASAVLKPAEPREQTSQHSHAASWLAALTPSVTQRRNTREGFHIMQQLQVDTPLPTPKIPPTHQQRPLRTRSAAALAPQRTPLSPDLQLALIASGGCTPRSPEGSVRHSILNSAAMARPGGCNGSAARPASSSHSPYRASQSA